MIAVRQERCCLQASIASLFELPLEDVPVVPDEGWQHVLREWLNERGWTFYAIGFDEQAWKSFPPQGHTLLCGQVSHSKLEHATVALDGKTVHDPLPSSGILDNDARYHLIFVPLNPANPQPIGIERRAELVRQGEINETT